MEYTEKKKAEMKNTIFGEVLAELLEARDMPPVIPYVRGLMKRTGTDTDKLIARIEGEWAGHPGDATMAALSERLELSERERLELAYAMTFEGRRPEMPVFGAVEITDEDAAQDWRELPRSEMFNRVIVAVDGARAEAEDAGDERYARYVETVLFPFLEEEQARAQIFEWRRESESE